jgi:hypothetical protein
MAVSGLADAPLVQVRMSLEGRFDWFTHGRPKGGKVAQTRR